MSDEVFRLEAPTGGFREEYFSDRDIATSDCNVFIPAYSLFRHELHIFKDEDTDETLEIAEYSMPLVHPARHAYRRWGDFIRELKISSNPFGFSYKVAGVDNIINAFRGILYTDDYEILMCLGINTDYVLNTNFEELSSKTDYSKYAIFLSDKLLTEPEYKNFIKKLETEYITPLRQKGIDVIYTNKITSWMYKNNFTPPKFKSVIEMNKHLKNEIPNLILEGTV